MRVVKQFDCGRLLRYCRRRRGGLLLLLFFSLLDVGVAEALVDVIASNVLLVLLLQLVQLCQQLTLEILYARLLLFQPLYEQCVPWLVALLLVNVLLDRVYQTRHHLWVRGLVLDMLVNALWWWWRPI